jgi:hypothetical protein
MLILIGVLAGLLVLAALALWYLWRSRAAALQSADLEHLVAATAGAAAEQAQVEAKVARAELVKRNAVDAVDDRKKVADDSSLDDSLARLNGVR